MLGVRKGSQMTPYLEACCLRMSANVSYQNAANEVAFLTGISVSASTQQRLVQAYEFATPTVPSESPLTEIALLVLDGWNPELNRLTDAFRFQAHNGEQTMSLKS